MGAVRQGGGLVGERGGRMMRFFGKEGRTRSPFGSVEHVLCPSVMCCTKSRYAAFYISRIGPLAILETAYLKVRLATSLISK